MSALTRALLFASIYIKFSARLVGLALVRQLGGRARANLMQRERVERPSERAGAQDLRRPARIKQRNSGQRRPTSQWLRNVR